MKHHLFSYLKIISLSVWLVWLWQPAGAQNETLPATFQPEAQASYTFGQMMPFSLKVTNTPALSGATLFVSTPQFDSTFVKEVEITAVPGERITLEYPLDLTQVRIQPFTTVKYWWALHTADGVDYKLPSDKLAYDDDQFEWKRTEQAGVKIFWVADGVELGQVGLDIVLEVLPAIQNIIEANLPDPLRVYIYPTSNDLRAALRLTGQAWVGGHASPELGVIMLAAENPRTAVIDLRRTLPHELSHLLIYEAAGTEYDSVPKWFDEGLATLFEAVPNRNYELALQSALENDALIPFETLCEHFPDNSTEQIYLAYAQSGALVKFIRDRHGNDALRRMVDEIADGANCETVVPRVLNISLDDLVDQWLAEVRPSPFVSIGQNMIWFILLVGGFGITLLLLLIPRR